MKSKRLILEIIGFIAFLVLVYVAYNGLTKEYKDDSNESSEKDVLIEENKKIKATDFTVYDEEMNPVKLSDYEGTPVVLNFWATWCGYCKEEMSDIQTISEKYSDDQIKILMINMTDGRNETKENAIAYMKNNNYTMKLLLDMDQEVARKYRVSGIPRTIFIDRNGYINQDVVGKLDSEMLKKKIEELINE